MADQGGPEAMGPWHDVAQLVASVEQGLATAKTALAALEEQVGELKAKLPQAPSADLGSQEPLQSPEPEERAGEEEEIEEIEVEVEAIECPLCDNEIRSDLIMDLGTKYLGTAVVVCKLCWYYSFFRGADTRCPRTRQLLNKKLIETLPQNKQGFKKFAPTRGIAKGCKRCKYPKDGRGCKHCILP